MSKGGKYTLRDVTDSTAMRILEQRCLDAGRNVKDAKEIDILVSILEARGFNMGLDENGCTGISSDGYSIPKIRLNPYQNGMPCRLK